MNITLLQKALWAAGFLFHAALLCVLIVRSRWRSFPVLSCLIGFQLTESLVLYFVFHYGTSHQYAKSYWTFTWLDFVLQISLIFEVAAAVFRPAGEWIKNAFGTFLILSTVSTLTVIGLCLRVSPPTMIGLHEWEMRGELITSMLTCELFLCMLAVANSFRLLWRSHVMALGQGMMAWAICALTGDVIFFATGSLRLLNLTDQLRMYVYLGTICFWVISFWLPELGRVPTQLEIRERLVALDQRLGCSKIQS